MRALAEYVMKGRSQAVLAVVFATGTVLFAWLGAAIVALVVLRKGTKQGSFVLFWGLLPATYLATVGDTGPIVTLLGTTLTAVVLRVTGSWSWALVTAVGSGLLTAVVLSTVGAGYVELILQLLRDTFAELAKQSANADASNPLVLPTALQIAGLMGLTNAFTAAMCLLLARWWQALLYNPGGFQAEFHRLRLAPQLTVLLIALGLALSLMGSDFRFWAVIFALPLVFAGFALIHGLAGHKQLKNSWLGLIYGGWLMLTPVRAVVLLLAVADSWLDFRSRLDVNKAIVDKSAADKPDADKPDTDNTDADKPD